MGKVQISFEVDQVALENAKVFVAKLGLPLDKLVSALLASLGRDEDQGLPATDPYLRVLVAASTGQISMMEVARQLELPDTGYVFQPLAAPGLPQSRLPSDCVSQQLNLARDALDGCLNGSDKTARFEVARGSADVKWHTHDLMALLRAKASPRCTMEE